MSKYNLVNIILGALAVIGFIIMMILRSAILTAVPTVASGYSVYESASSTISSTNLDSQEVKAHNQMYSAYFGDTVSASEVKQLISIVSSNNLASQSSSDPSKILIKLNNTPVTDSSSVTTGKTYKVELADDKTDDSDPTASGAKEAAYYTSGYIRTITITEN